eukprot:11305252-Heterocapsa_arctica.AAC.1
MTWLEAKVLDTTARPVDRLVCGRLRLATGGSVRHEDCRKTPVGRLEWLLHADNSIRGIRTEALETKTFARHWACSALGVTPEGDGWLQATYKLLVLAH